MKCLRRSVLSASVVLVSLSVGCSSAEERKTVTLTSSATTSSTATGSGGEGGGGGEAAATTTSGTGGAGGLGGAGGAGGAGGFGGAGGSGGDPLPAECSNGVMDPGEIGIDCGGPCLGCPGDMCVTAAECLSHNCANNTCVPPSCADNIKNGSETDADCGGPGCGPCADGLGCATPSDCVSQVCSTVCFPPVCNDGVKNGKETGVDCGGADCGKCSVGAGCSAKTDCISDSCTGGICVCQKGMITASSLASVTYCIDATEVTNKEYAVFVNTPNLPLQDPYCSWNASYVPVGGLAPSSKDYFPVTNVDWCDAYAYCKARGKVLCGDIGGGHADVAVFANAAEDAWYNACSGQGAAVYPYGATYDAMICNGSEAGLGQTRAVQNSSGALTTNTCQGNFGGLYDMSGDVAEWEDACAAYSVGAAGATDLCRLRGGSYLSDSTELACAADATTTRDAASPDVGFRCCQ